MPLLLQYLAFVSFSAVAVLLGCQAVAWWGRISFERRLKERLNILNALIAESNELWLASNAAPVSALQQLQTAIACRNSLVDGFNPTMDAAAQIDKALACVQCARAGLKACPGGRCTCCDPLQVLNAFDASYGWMPGVMEISPADDCIRVIVRDRRTFNQLPSQFADSRIQREMHVEYSLSPELPK